MSSQLAAAPQRDKRHWPGDSPSSDLPSDVQPPKRACLGLTDFESDCPTLHALELYELENPLETNVAESATREDLVSEMMRSLEKAIGAIDDSSLPQLPLCGIASPPLPSSPSVGANESELLSTEPTVSSHLSDSGHSCEPSGSEYSAAGTGRSFVDSVHDGPGISECSRVELAFPEAASAESQLVENCCSSFLIDADILQTSPGFFPLLRNDWLDDTFGQFEDSGFGLVRDSCDLVSLDYCF